MKIKFECLIVVLFVGISSYGQQKNLANELKCTQYVDTLSNRTIYQFPEKDVSFKGGQQGLISYIQRRLIYDNRQIKDQTIVTFTMIVEADGSVSNVSLMSAPSGVPNDVIERVMAILTKLPKAKPAECNGQKVPVRKIVPIVLLPESY